ncbi:hypothetical protein L873DRAFT_1274864 [Choiromyces venosus 120613-1]|uniref:Uncharacterized protein n=1 Tax=Choiromyces venosus 120613-1 TaxID=1336337 RepID=A0A3N4K4Z7_9PEZI|nr:hypothetical protein L873DRAFT_1274864 [Choiromyces venosus 120613-1]
MSTPHALARHRLHVSTLPASLLWCEGEFSEVYSHLSAATAEAASSCIHTSGIPGARKPLPFVRLLHRCSTWSPWKNWTTLHLLRATGWKSRSCTGVSSSLEGY